MVLRFRLLGISQILYLCVAGFVSWFQVRDWSSYFGLYDANTAQQMDLAMIPEAALDYPSATPALEKAMAPVAVNKKSPPKFDGHNYDTSKIFDFPVKQPYKRPPYISMINKTTDEVVGNVGGLLDFALLGESKCATTFVLRWLQRQPDSEMFPSEDCSYLNPRETRLIKNLYKLPYNHSQALHGIKCPLPWTPLGMERIQDHYQSTRLIAAVRHPVLWFKSVYEYRIKEGMALPDANELIGGPCLDENWRICTDRANYHFQLSMLGKTPFGHAEETELFESPYENKSKHQFNITNPVFLYSIAQFADETNETRQEEFYTNFGNYLGTPRPLERLPKREKKQSAKDSERESLNHGRLPICNDEYKELREALMYAGGRAATWIRQYFLASPSVYVSHLDFFLSDLDSWTVDPCSDEY